MNKPITFRMVAYTDAAGKYMEGACRNGNEDNFYVDDNLGDDMPNHCLPDEPTELSACGLLMAVADGMGGMNAGEIASQIATETVKEYFLPGKITPKMAATHESRKKYLEEVIVNADARIKQDASHHPQHEGMGSTIILAWLVANELTISWCGDSRAYRFNPLNGIELLSEDHSYVQSLVQKGVITYEQTFDHPQGNIVTRSLGDPGKKAQPETRLVKVNKGDVILLCSDGLNGVLRDCTFYDEDGASTSGETIESIIARHLFSMKACREALWTAAEQADWYDNVTAILCQVIDGAPAAVKKPESPRHRQLQEVPTSEQGLNPKKSFWKRSAGMKLLIGLIAGIVLLLIGFYIGAGTNGHPTLPASDKDTVLTDSGGKKTVVLPNLEEKEADSEGVVRNPAPVHERPANNDANELTPSTAGAPASAATPPPTSRVEKSKDAAPTEDTETTGNAGNETGQAEAYDIYIVKDKETLYGIQEATGVSMEEIKELNHLKDDTIQAGMKLKIPKKKSK